MELIILVDFLVAKEVTKTPCPSLLYAEQCELVRMLVLGRLRSLTHLDDVLITEEEAAAAIQNTMGSRINQVWEASSFSTKPRSINHTRHSVWLHIIPLQIGDVETKDFWFYIFLYFFFFKKKNIFVCLWLCRPAF